MHPVVFNLFGYPVHTYAMMMAMGFVVAILLAARYGERVGFHRDLTLDLLWWIMVSGLVGSRIAFIIVNWEQYYYPCVDVAQYNVLFPEKPISEPDCTRLLRFWNGGLVFYGGVIGSILTMVWFLRREKLPFLPMADVIIPSLAIGQFFGRMGCLGAGCCWGKPTDVAWAIEFPARSMAFKQHVEEGLITAGEAHSHAVHPTQFYDSMMGILIFCVLIYIRQRKTFHGQVFITWAMLYPLGRSIVELFRGDDFERGFVVRIVNEPLNAILGLPEGSAAFLSTSQFISLCVVAVAGVLLYRSRKGNRAMGPAPGEGYGGASAEKAKAKSD